MSRRTSPSFAAGGVAPSPAEALAAAADAVVFSFRHQLAMRRGINQQQHMALRLLEGAAEAFASPAALPPFERQESRPPAPEPRPAADLSSADTRVHFAGGGVRYMNDLREQIRRVEFDMVNRPASGAAFIGERSEVAAVIEGCRALAAHLSEQIEHCQTRIQDGSELGAAAWRIALEDVVRENRALLARLNLLQSASLEEA